VVELPRWGWALPSSLNLLGRWATCYTHCSHTQGRAHSRGGTRAQVCASTHTSLHTHPPTHPPARLPARTHARTHASHASPSGAQTRTRTHTAAWPDHAQPPDTTQGVRAAPARTARHASAAAMLAFERSAGLASTSRASSGSCSCSGSSSSGSRRLPAHRRGRRALACTATLAAPTPSPQSPQPPQQQQQQQQGQQQQQQQGWDPRANGEQLLQPQQLSSSGSGSSSSSTATLVDPPGSSSSSGSSSSYVGLESSPLPPPQPQRQRSQSGLEIEASAMAKCIAMHKRGGTGLQPGQLRWQGSALEAAYSRAQQVCSQYAKVRRGCGLRHCTCAPALGPIASSSSVLHCVAPPAPVCSTPAHASRPLPPPTQTFYLGTQLMTPDAARGTWAIYVWARRTDELVDGPNASKITPQVRRGPAACGCWYAWASNGGRISRVCVRKHACLCACVQACN